MRLLIATDAFPPVCGGSGWSSYELARGLRARGHEVVVVRPTQAPAEARAAFDGFDVWQPRVAAPGVPYVRNYFKNERNWRILADRLHRLVVDERIDLIHAQHVLTGPASVGAARRAGVPVVCTVRDYWPVCYWSDLVLDYADEELCPGCSAAMMTRCVRPRAGALWPAALPFVPYMRANLRRKRAALARADAVIAVSSTMARDLRARAPELDPARLHTIPNPVDTAAILRSAARPRRLDGRYAIYVGKLAPNKGAAKLVEAVARARLDWPVVVVGDGPERGRMEHAARGTGRDLRFTGWLDRQDALDWLAGASLLIFPSHGPESLSRVLIEAGALGVSAAAMDTGGTRDIVVHERTGLVSESVDGLARDVARLAADADLRRRLGEAARSHVDERFGAAAVVARIDALYASLAGSAVDSGLGSGTRDSGSGIRDQG